MLKHCFNISSFNNKIISIFLSVIAFVFSSLHVCAQDYSYREYGLREGLAGLTIYSIAQDKDGFLWIGTETGLSRFDGSHFKTFTTRDGLPDNEIIKIFVDSDNRIWLLPFANTVCYFENGILHTSNNDSLLGKLRLKNIPYGICQDKNKNIAVYYDKGLNIISFKNKSVTDYENIGYYGTNITAVGISSSGNFLLSIKYVEGRSEETFFEFQDNGFINTKQIIEDSKNTRSSMIFNSNFRSYIQGDHIYLENSLYNNHSSIKIPSKFLRLGWLTDSSFSVITIDTIYLYSVKTLNCYFKFYTDKNTNTIFSDRNGNYWVGTVGHGLYKIVSLSMLSYRFRVGKNEMAVYSIFKKENNLFTGTESASLWNIDLKLNKIISSQNLNEYFDDPIKFNERIYFIKETSNSGYLVGFGKGLFNFENINDLRKPRSVVLTSQGAKYIYSYSNYTLISNIASVYKIPTPLLFTNNGLLPKITDTVWKGRSTCAFFFDKKYYIGTLNGLYIVNEEKEYEFMGTKNELLSSRINGMIQSDDSTLWIATYGKGVIGFKNEKVIKKFTEKDGLASEMCRTIEINNNKLWVGTDKGISCIDLREPGKNIRTYSSKDGLACDIINCLYIDNDTVYAGTPFGLSIFNPSEISRRSSCNMLITSVFSRKDTIVYPKDILYLHAGDNLLHIEYSGISLKDDGNITYYYRMNGLQNQWQTTQQNVLEYPSLNPGDYTFEIYAQNSFDIKSKMMTLQIHIDRKIYQEKWFIAFVIFLIAAFVWFLIRKYVNNIKSNALQKQNMLRKMNELEQSALKSQMNPHFIFNCLNSIQQFIFEKDPIESNRFITNFASLIRQTLEISDKKMITLEEEIKYIDTYLKIEQGRFEDKFEFVIHTDKNIEANATFLPPLLLQPFIENSIRHGIRNLESRKGFIEVNFAKEASDLVCKIEDNGIGREAAANLKTDHAASYQSKGMKLVERRIEGLNETSKSKIKMTIIDKIADTGTIVIVKIPKEIYSDKIEE